MKRKDFQKRAVDEIHAGQGKALLWEKLEKEIQKPSWKELLWNARRLIGMGFAALMVITVSLVSTQLRSDVETNSVQADFELVNQSQDGQASFTIQTPGFYDEPVDVFAEHIYFEPAINFEVTQFFAHEYQISFLEPVDFSQIYLVSIEYEKANGHIETHQFEWNPSL